MLAVEAADALPQLCRQCLGARNAHRLVRDSAQGACRLCGVPFVTFHWKLGAARKQTLICLDCARKRGACQCCLRDTEFALPLDLRDATLRILHEEGGTAADRAAVLAAVAEQYAPRRTDSTRKTPRLEETVAALPEAGIDRPAGCDTLCVYGIETDLDSAQLRAYFHAPIRRVEYLPASRLAFFEFEEPPELAAPTVLIDGRELVFGWGAASIPVEQQRAVGAVIRSYLQNQRKPL